MERSDPKETCLSCSFQSHSGGCVICGHPNANMNENGNGTYVYVGWSCDIGKYRERLPNENRLIRQSIIDNINKNLDWLGYVMLRSLKYECKYLIGEPGSGEKGKEIEIPPIP